MDNCLQCNEQEKLLELLSNFKKTYEALVADSILATKATQKRIKLRRLVEDFSMFVNILVFGCRDEESRGLYKQLKYPNLELLVQ